VRGLDGDSMTDVLAVSFAEDVRVFLHAAREP
jgi:hypothetical protein